MKKRILSVILSAFLLLGFNGTVLGAEISSEVSFSYQPSGGGWTEFSVSVEDDGYIDCLKIQTDSSKDYYLSYRTYNEGKGAFYPYVTSIENDYAGTKGRRIQRLGIRAIDKKSGNGIAEGVVVLYRVKVDGLWLPWVSNADPEWMYFVQRKYGISGVMDTVSGYAGYADGSFITGIEIRIFEETAITDSKGDVGKQKLIDAPFINQLPDYPTGCESVSAVMALNYYGLTLTADDFIDSFLEKAPKADFDPNVSFGGDPYISSGMGCWAPVIEKAVNKIPNCRKIKAETLYGVYLSELCNEYIDNDIPVLVWATADMQTPKNGTLIEHNGKKIQWIAPEHCLLLVGYDEENYIFNDPLMDENISYPRSSTETAYCGLGLQAVVITASEEEHTAGEWATVKEPTAFESGKKEQSCIVCGKILGEEEIPSLYLFGDIDCDGLVTGSDLVTLRRWILENGGQAFPTYYDTNCDSIVNIRDLMQIKRYIAGETTGL